MGSKKKKKKKTVACSRGKPKKFSKSRKKTEESRLSSGEHEEGM